MSATATLFSLRPESNSYLTALAANRQSRSIEVAISLAMVMSSKAQIPGSAIDSPVAYFNGQAGLAGMKFLNTINEITPVDFRRAREIAIQMFTQRYEAAYMPFAEMAPIHTDGCNGLWRLYKYDKHFSLDVLQVMEKCADNIVRHYNAFKKIADEMEGV